MSGATSYPHLCARNGVTAALPSTEATGRATTRVLIQSQLRSYTGGAKQVDVDIAAGASESDWRLGDVIAEIERRYPGFRFRIIDEQGRIRPHIKIFVGVDLARDLCATLPKSKDVMIVGALSGG